MPNPAADPSSKRFQVKLCFALLFLFTLGGMASSGYLSFAHYRNFTDISYQSFCAISRSLNCDTVAQSPYAIFLGVPVAVWGFLGYLFFLTLAFLFKPNEKELSGTALLCLIASLFSLVSIALALVSIIYIHSYCLLCLTSYGINFGLFLVAWMAQSRFGAGSFRTSLRKDIARLREQHRQVIAIIIASVTLAGAAILFYPQYWLFETLPANALIERGITEDGNPWIGAEHPTLTIIEYADYLCFQCGKMHNHLRQLVNKYPDKIRLVHRHFPLDSLVNPVAKETVHPNAGLISLFALIAQEHNLFWEVNDALYREARTKQSINFSSIAKEVGLDLTHFQDKLNNLKLREKLANDIRTGIALKIAATPSYVIDGNLYSGAIPEYILSPAMKGY